jgi:hypothetical protein
VKVDFTPVLLPSSNGRTERLTIDPFDQKPFRFLGDKVG